jgi:hypothetical protein
MVLKEKIKAAHRNEEIWQYIRNLNQDKRLQSEKL